MKANRLRCEYLAEPIGVDFLRPRLMWNADSGIRQTAYQVITADWDSGKVESSSMRAVYPRPLSSRERVNWKIRLWDENDQAGAWSESFFELGLRPEDWSARWITGNYKVNKKRRYPVDCFRKRFQAGEIAKARLYISACGLYEAHINGKKAGHFCLAPGHTDYRRRVQLQTIDVTDLICAGQNELTVWLADGWYRGSCGAWGIRNQYGSETKLIAQLELTYRDASVQTITSDESWDWSNDGPIRFADNKDGEVYDANRNPSYSGKAKSTTHVVMPSASNNVPVTEHEQFTPALSRTRGGKWLADFGQNFAGYLSFRVQAKGGEMIRLRFGELLGADGELDQTNIQLKKKDYVTPRQEIQYTCKPGWNNYKTRFAIFGYQYAEIDAPPSIEILPENVAGIAVYSDMAETGFFESSNPLLNRFFEATKWSMKSNSADLPTDCPTRERHGWTGDAQLFFETAGYLFDYAAFSKKYLRDMYDWQEESGRLPHIAPEGGADAYMRTMNGSVGWSDAGILIPYRFAGLFDDPEILREFYSGMARYARFMEKRCGKRIPLVSERVRLSKDAMRYLVNAGQSYGEWAEPADVCAFRWTDFVAPHPEVSTAYTAYILGLMSQIAGRLGYTEDEAEFQRYSSGCRKAYQELVSDGKYSLNTDRQAQLVRPLALGLLSEEQRAYAQNRLLKALENYGWRLGTGFLSTPLILDVLAQFDIDAAYRLLENEEVPGWLSMPKAGATTIWEAWEGPDSQAGGIGSLNHYSKGAACEWLFKTMCGIRVDGENHFVIAPCPGGSFRYAGAVYNSVFGKVESRWVRENGEIRYSVSIPANCSADLVLPGEKPKTLYTGSYVFSSGKSGGVEESNS